MGLRESIVQQASRQWLALRAVDNVFGQHLPEPLGAPTDNLPFDQPWVDDTATVVDSNVAQDGDLSRLPTHLYDYGMRAKGERRRLEGVGPIENRPPSPSLDPCVLLAAAATSCARVKRASGGWRLPARPFWKTTSSAGQAGRSAARCARCWRASCTTA